LRRFSPFSTLFPYTTLFRSAFADIRHPDSFVSQNPQLPRGFLLDSRRPPGAGHPGLAPLTSWIRASPNARQFHVDAALIANQRRSEEHTSELQSLAYLVCRL